MRHFGFFYSTPRIRGLGLSASRVVLAALASLTMLAGAFDSADARRRHYDAAQSQPKPQAEFKKPEGPLFAVVSLADQHVTFYDANGVYSRGLVSTGVPSHPTPPGIFTILEKERWHRSNIYSGAPMPWMQRLAWTGVAMHEGAVHPGHTASHGCIRMQPAFAKEMWAVTSIGQRVIIAPQDIKPADIVSAHLPQPLMRMLPLAPAPERVTAGKSAVEPVSLDPKEAAKPVNPLEFAKSLKAAAAAKAASAAASKKAAQALLDSKPAEIRVAAREADIAEQALRQAREELEDATRAAAKADGEEAVNRRSSTAEGDSAKNPRSSSPEGDSAKKRAAERKAAAEAKAAAAEAKAREAKGAKEAKDKELLAAQNAIREADAATAEAAAEAKQAERRLEPVSVLISRKTGRIYVRQATVKLFDMPIAIRDADKPLGTHLFIATRPGADGASLRWVSLTPPAAAEVRIRHRSSRRGHVVHAEETPAPAQHHPETAAHALDRIEIPAEAAQRIGELTWTGATLIISDVSMSDGKFPMDFQILQQTIVREWD